MLLCPVNCGKEKRRHNVGCHVCSEVWASNSEQGKQVVSLLHNEKITFLHHVLWSNALYCQVIVLVIITWLHCYVDVRFKERPCTQAQNPNSKIWIRKKENIGRNNIWIKQCNNLRQSTRRKGDNWGQRQGCTKNSWWDNKIQVKQKGLSKQSRRREGVKPHEHTRQVGKLSENTSKEWHWKAPQTNRERHRKHRKPLEMQKRRKTRDATTDSDLKCVHVTMNLWRPF